MTDEATVARLNAPTPPDRIQWRGDRTNYDKTSMSVLGYIDARYVMEALDAIVGPANWQDRYEDIPGGTRCGISIFVNDQWVTKWDAAPHSDIESVKGGHSDSLKRAAVKWGIGRDLYDLPDLWVPCKETRPNSGKYVPAVLPSWDGSRWVTNGSSSTSSGRAGGGGAARPSAPTTPPDLEDPTLDAPPVWEDARPRQTAQEPSGGVMWSKALFEAAEAAGIDKRAISDTSKRLFGKDKWKVTELTDGERWTLAYELGLVAA